MNVANVFNVPNVNPTLGKASAGKNVDNAPMFAKSTNRQHCKKPSP